MTVSADNPIRIAIVDDHGIVRQGLRMLLSRPTIQVIAEGERGQDGVKIARDHAPDVMLLDIRMKDGDGLKYLPEICKTSPKTKVIMLTTYANPGYLARAINDGAVGYLSKETEPDKIVEAIYAAYNQGQLFDQSLLTQALQNAVDPSPPEPEPSELPLEMLSEREMDVLKLVAAGMSNASIAKSLNISVPTVKTHVQHILRKLHVADRTQAALWAVREGIVD
jgi:NarL family two-component system response regulator LiaR